MSVGAVELEARLGRSPVFKISRLATRYVRARSEVTFRFFEAGGGLCVGEESRSAIRGFGARLRWDRLVAGVSMMTSKSKLSMRSCQYIIIRCPVLGPREVRGRKK